jgi:hypothetical protein
MSERAMRPRSMVRDAALRAAPRHDEEFVAIFAIFASTPSVILRSRAQRGVSKDGPR